MPLIFEIGASLFSPSMYAGKIPPWTKDAAACEKGSNAA